MNKFNLKETYEYLILVLRRIYFLILAGYSFGLGAAAIIEQDQRGYLYAFFIPIGGYIVYRLIRWVFYGK